MRHAIAASLLVLVVSLARVAHAGCLDGRWRWLSDSGGGKPKAGAIVTMRAFGDSLEITADQPGQHVVLTGTYRCAGDKVTVALPELGDGDRCANAPFTLRGDQLLLPFQFLSDDRGTSAWRKLKTNVFSRVETRPCPAKDERGVPILMCVHGLAGSSAGQDCLYTVTYQDDTELDKSLGCALSCKNPDWKPEVQWACDVPAHACYARFKDQIIYRNLEALAAPVRRELLAETSRLVETLKATALPGEGKPMDAAQAKAAAEVQEAKRKIVDAVLTEMIPYDAVCTPERETIKWEYPRTYSADPAVEAAGEVPMQIYGWMSLFHLFGSAFYTETRAPRTIVAGSADELAALLIHELVHMRQEKFGFAEGPEVQRDARQRLHEIMAYDIASRTAYYRFVLDPKQQRALVTVGLEANIRAFHDLWAKLGKPVKEGVARWAWSRYDWMRSRMLFQPQQHGGVWGLLCAANDGGSFCGMSGGGGRPDQPDSDTGLE